MKLQDTTLDENLMSGSGVVPRFVNHIIKVEIPKKQMLVVNVILSWVDDNVVKKYIDKATVMEVIISLCVN